MAISDDLTELQQNTTALGAIRTSMREKLIAKGVDASTHDYADFPSDVESIPSGGLPSAYEAVEYIQSSGTQALKIPYEIKFADVVRMKVNISYTSAWESFFGWDGYRKLYIQLESTNKLYINRNGTTQSVSFTYGTDSSITLVNDLIAVNNKSAKYNCTANDVDGSFGIFCLLNSGGVPVVGTAAKLYSLSIINSNCEAVINLIPCYRKSDNEIGMFDTVNNQFYTNAGTGDFTCYPAPPA